MSRPLHIKNASIWHDNHSEVRDIYTKNGRIVDSPAHDALVIDLEGYTLFPGLVNAHDHLELNHYPRTKFREVYNNAHEWGEDVNARLNDEPFKTLRAYPLWDKVFIGGLKNLLCGATTVVHHGVPHKPLFRKDFPVRVLQKYGWAHSLHFSTEAEIINSYRSTPKDTPWFIHLAEGTDDIAKGEYQRLNKLGCVGTNTVIVHGVGLTFDDVEAAWGQYRPNQGGVELVWCPTSNYYLFGKKAHQDAAITNGHWSVVHAAMHFMGSDSRLTADGDFLDEIRFASTVIHWVMDIILETVAWLYPKWYSVTSIGNFLALPLEIGNGEWLCNASRKDIPMIIHNGIPRIGNPELMAKFPHIQTVACTLDGVEKRIHIELAKQIHRCKLKEPGLEVDALPQNRFWLI